MEEIKSEIFDEERGFMNQEEGRVKVMYNSDEEK